MSLDNAVNERAVEGSGREARQTRESQTGQRGEWKGGDGVRCDGMHSTRDMIHEHRVGAMPCPLCSLLCWRCAAAAELSGSVSSAPLPPFAALPSALISAVRSANSDPNSPPLPLQDPPAAAAGDSAQAEKTITHLACRGTSMNNNSEDMKVLSAFILNLICFGFVFDRLCVFLPVAKPARSFSPSGPRCCAALRCVPRLHSPDRLPSLHSIMSGQSRGEESTHTTAYDWVGRRCSCRRLPPLRGTGAAAD